MRDAVARLDDATVNVGRTRPVPLQSATHALTGLMQAQQLPFINCRTREFKDRE